MQEPEPIQEEETNPVNYLRKFMYLILIGGIVYVIRLPQGKHPPPQFYIIVFITFLLKLVLIK